MSAYSRPSFGNDEKSEVGGLDRTFGGFGAQNNNQGSSQNSEDDVSGGGGGNGTTRHHLWGYSPNFNMKQTDQIHQDESPHFKDLSSSQAKKEVSGFTLESPTEKEDRAQIAQKIVEIVTNLEKEKNKLSASQAQQVSPLLEKYAQIVGQENLQKFAPEIDQVLSEFSEQEKQA